MVIMGGGPDVPSKDSGKKELVLCALPWPGERINKAVDSLKEEFKDVDVKCFYTVHENGNMLAIDIPEGMQLLSSLQKHCFV
jgi:hypothetical protein